MVICKKKLYKNNRENTTKYCFVYEAKKRNKKLQNKYELINLDEFSNFIKNK